MLIGVHGGSMCAHRKKLILNPRPDYKLQIGDMAFVISDRRSTAHTISTLTFEQIGTCVEGMHFLALLAITITHFPDKIEVHQVFKQIEKGRTADEDSSNSGSDDLNSSEKKQERDGGEENGEERDLQRMMSWLQDTTRNAVMELVHGEQGQYLSASTMEKKMSKGKELADILHHIERGSTVQRFHFLPFHNDFYDRTTLQEEHGFLNIFISTGPVHGMRL